MEIKELKPRYTTNKSYYKKAHIIITDDGEILLRSYTTNVASYNPQTKQFTKLWNGYSRTTMKHIIDFCGQYNIDFKPNKRNWLNLPYDNDRTQYIIAGSNGIYTHEFKSTLYDNYDDAQEYADTLNNRNTFWQYWVVEYDN